MRVEGVSLNLAIPSPLLTTCGSADGRDSGPVTGGVVTLGMDAHSVVSYSLQPRGLLPTRLLCPWDSPGKNTEWVAILSSRGSS